MSKSYHVTRKDLSRFSKKELNELSEDENTLLNEYAEKSRVKKEVKKSRKVKKENNDSP